MTGQAGGSAGGRPGGLCVVGVNHEMAPVEVRERLAFGPERLPLALAALQAVLASDGDKWGAHADGGAHTGAPLREPGSDGGAGAGVLPCDEGNDAVEGAHTGAPVRNADAAEVVILSTCNRTEVHAWTGDGDCCQAERAGAAIREYLAERGGLEPAAACDSLYVHYGDDAARHLLRVAAGLDSLVIGENEILGQVKAAFEQAHAAGTTGPVLSVLFRFAVRAGKRVRSETEIGRAALSVATIVVEMARETFGSLSERTALLIGAGKMSSIAGQALVRAGLRCVLVANRTFDRAQRLATCLGGSAVRFDALTENLATADIVICSTGAPHIVLHADAVRRAVSHRPPGSLLVVDLAVPRDVEPSIADIPAVRLADIDDLEALVQANHPLGVAVREEAERIVQEELDGFRSWQDARCCVPVIQALRERAEAICEAEVAKTLPRLGDLTPQQQDAVAAMARAVANKLLHEPIVNLKEPPDGSSPDAYADLTGKLFGLN